MQREQKHGCRGSAKFVQDQHVGANRTTEAGCWHAKSMGHSILRPTMRLITLGEPTRGDTEGRGGATATVY